MFEIVADSEKLIASKKADGRSKIQDTSLIVDAIEKGDSTIWQEVIKLLRFRDTYLGLPYSLSDPETVLRAAFLSVFHYDREIADELSIPRKTVSRCRNAVNWALRIINSPNPESSILEMSKREKRVVELYRRYKEFR
jgi:hypothetical protein